MTVRDRLVELVDGRETLTAVGRAAAARLPEGFEAGPARRGRVTWKPGGRLRAFYEITDGERQRVVAVRWDGLDDEPAIEVWPEDRQWPHLGDLLGSAVLREARVAAGLAADGMPIVRVVRYRPGQRHVVWVGGADGAIYVKVGPAGSGTAGAARARLLAEALQNIGAGAPMPCWWSDPLGAVAARELAGTPFVLTDELNPAALTSAERIGALLASLHRSPVPAGAHELPTVRADGAAQVTWRACEHIRALHPELADAIRSVLDRAVESIGTERSGSLLHGDAKLEHFFFDRDMLAVIDLDSAAVGGPAADLGRMMAAAQWDTGAATFETLRAALLAGYGPDRLDQRALSGWTALALVRQAARRIPVLASDLAQRMADTLRMAAQQ